MAIKKSLTNVTTGKIYINWNYTLKGGKVRNGRIEFLPFEIKNCDFIDENDYKQMVSQNDYLFNTQRIIDCKKTDSKKDQILEKNEKESHKKLEENAGSTETETQEFRGENGAVGTIKTQVEQMS